MSFIHLISFSADPWGLRRWTELKRCKVVGLQKQRPVAVACAAERLYFPDLRSSGSSLLLPTEESKHVRSRRLVPGDAVEIFDGVGAVARGQFAGFEGRAAKICELQPVKLRTPPFQITAAVAMPKGSRADWMVEKLTELGVANILPIDAQRGVAETTESRVNRWTRLAIAACKQSQRDLVPQFDRIETVSGLASRIRDGQWATTMLAAFGGQSLASLTSTLSSPSLFIVGPEGGFTDEEIDLLSSCSCSMVSLGANRLRVETAAIAFASALVIGAWSNEDTG